MVDYVGVYTKYLDSMVLLGKNGCIWGTTNTLNSKSRICYDQCRSSLSLLKSYFIVPISI